MLARDMSVEELITHPDRLGTALNVVAHGRVVKLVSHGNRIAAIVPADLLEELQETVDVLSDSEAVQNLVEGRQAVARGDVVRGARAVRDLLNERQ